MKQTQYKRANGIETPKNPQKRNKWRKFANAGKNILSAKAQVLQQIISQRQKTA